MLVRLLLPFSISSPFSVYALAGEAPTAGTIAEMTAEYFIPAAPVANGSISTAVPPQASIAINPWLLTWAIGAGICTLYFAILYFKCHKEFLVSSKLENPFISQWISQHKAKRTITIRQSDRISAPLTYGVFRPVILMPCETDWTDTRQMQYILQHEYVHIRRFDAMTKLVLTAALCLHWFNPLVWVLYLLANRDMELSCDEAVVHSFGEAIKSSYALTLISMEEKKSGLVPFYNSFGKNPIEERIRAIMKFRKPTAATFLLTMVLVIGVTTGFATSAVASAEVPETIPKTPPIAIEDNTIRKATEPPTAALPDYEEYEAFGLTYDKDSERFFLHGELVRYFEDKALSRSFGAYEDGKDHVYAVRNADGLLTGFELLNLKDDALDIKYREYVDFGLKFKKTDSNGMELHGKPISSFSDVAAGIGISRKNGGDGIEYQAVRDTADPGPAGVGRLVDIKPYPSNLPVASASSDVDAVALDIMQRTGNWGYIETYLPKMTKAGIDAVVDSYNSKHPNSNEHKKATDYYD